MKIYENLIQCTGRVLFKNYDESRKSLIFILGMFTPKLIPRGNRNADENNFNRDYPTFTMTGEEAKAVGESMEVGKNVSVIGHVDTQEAMRHVEKRTYQKEWTTVFVADQVYTDTYNAGFDNVTLAGDVVRVYKNAESGHKFYLVTLKILLPDGTPTRANFIHFDPGMNFEPKVGDHITMNGIIQTKRTTEGSQNRTLLSVVARFVTIDRK